MGLRPHPPRRPLNPGDAHGFGSAAILADRRGELPPGTSRGLTGQGPAGIAARRLASLVPHEVAGATRGGARTCASAGPDDGASPQPDPLGHLSSRNRGSTGWRLRCCTTQTRPKPGLTSPTIPPCGRRPCEQRPPGPDEGRSACAVPTSNRTEGRFLRFSAKRIGLRRHPRCLPSMSRLDGDA